MAGEVPTSPNDQWDGIGGRRYLGIGVVRGGQFEDADLWLSSSNMTPRLPDESWNEWAARTGEGQTTGQQQLESDEEGEAYGTN